MTADIKKMNPYKIDIGAVFTDKPKDHKKLKASEFKPLERELVFDIDMTDYDEIRTCCSGAAICKKCWFFMNTAVKVVDVALREDFGFQNLLWASKNPHCHDDGSALLKLSSRGPPEAAPPSRCPYLLADLRSTLMTSALSGLLRSSWCSLLDLRQASKQTDQRRADCCRRVPEHHCRRRPSKEGRAPIAGVPRN